MSWATVDVFAKSAPVRYTWSVDRDERRARRQREWSGGRIGAGQSAAFDRRFWAAASDAERLAAVWEMAQQAYRLEHPDGPPLRLDRSLGGVRRAGR